MHLVASREAIWLLLGMLGSVLLVSNGVVLLGVVAERTLSTLVILDLGEVQVFVAVSDHNLLLFILVLPLVLRILLYLVIIVGNRVDVEGLLPILDAKLLGRVEWLSRFGASKKLGLLLSLGLIILGMTILLSGEAALESALSIMSVLRVDIVDVWLLMHVNTCVIVVGSMANAMHCSS